jgi:hypothetical protein
LIGQFSVALFDLLFFLQLHSCLLFEPFAFQDKFVLSVP